LGFGLAVQARLLQSAIAYVSISLYIWRGTWTTAGSRTTRRWKHAIASEKKTGKRGGGNLYVSRLQGNKALEISHSLVEVSKTRLYYAPPVQRFVMLGHKLKGLVACSQSRSEVCPSVKRDLMQRQKKRPSTWAKET
jgi:hypothetical protein